jgi:hypothetical protein
MPQKTITIYDGDDFEKLAELQTQVRIAAGKVALLEKRAAQPAATPRAGDDEPSELEKAQESAQRAKDAFDAFVDKAATRAEAWELHHIGHEAWVDLVNAHPPREVTEGEGEGDGAKQVIHPDDAEWAMILKTAPFDTSTFGKALLLFVDDDDADHRTVAKLGGADPGTVLPKRINRLSQGQFDTLWVAAHQLNTGGVSDPKLARFSVDTKSTEG